MKETVKELLGIKGRRFYSFTTACLSLVDESNRINEILRKKNTQVQDLSKADFIVVTTCAVSRDSAHNSANNILRLDRISKQKPIFVGGCLSNAKEKDVLLGRKNIKFFTADEIFQDIDKVDRTCTNTVTRCDPFWLANMDRKADYLSGLMMKNRNAGMLYSFTTDGIIFSRMPFEFDTIRLSKGCNKHCTYCAIPNNRGRYIEHSIDFVKNQIKDSSKKYILIIGENVGCYSHLEDVLEYAGMLGKKIMIRYLEPEYHHRIKDEHLKDIVYIGVPMQSGSARILRDMHRPGNITAIKERFREWHRKGIFTGTSIILSYPTEKLSDYLRTLWFIISTPVNYTSFQNFSPRENSIAFEKYSSWDSNTAPIRFKFWLFDRMVGMKSRAQFAKAWCGVEKWRRT